MNRYGKGPAFGTSSKATAHTLCQKCLKRDIYECKAVAQERPYVSRPSRTQQLLNPKLVPKLNNEIPQELLRKKGIADELLAKAEEERGRKRHRQSEDPQIRPMSKRRRSASASSVSVSTISTNLSRSPSPRETSRNQERLGPRNSNLSKPLSSRDNQPYISKSQSLSPSPPRQRLSDSEKKRRRDSFSSVGSGTSDERRDSRERAGSRSTRRRFRQRSPLVRGRTGESRSPFRGRRRLPNNSHGSQDGLFSGRPANNIRQTRQRSLSPFSKRLALTQAMNMGR